MCNALRNPTLSVYFSLPIKAVFWKRLRTETETNPHSLPAFRQRSSSRISTKKYRIYAVYPRKIFTTKMNYTVSETHSRLYKLPFIRTLARRKLKKQTLERTRLLPYPKFLKRTLPSPLCRSFILRICTLYIFNNFTWCDSPTFKRIFVRKKFNNNIIVYISVLTRENFKKKFVHEQKGRGSGGEEDGKRVEILIRTKTISEGKRVFEVFRF